MFYKSKIINYDQGNISFISGLSILDLLFNCGIEQSIKILYNEDKNKEMPKLKIKDGINDLINLIC